jgi:hypothetical protein
MNDQSRSLPPYFFVVRLWPEKAEAEEIVWRGRIQNTADGEVRYFQGWEALVEVLLRLMEESKPEI